MGSESVQKSIDEKFGEIFTDYQSTLTILEGKIVSATVNPKNPQQRVISDLDKFNIQWWYKQVGFSGEVNFKEQSFYASPEQR